MGIYGLKKILLLFLFLFCIVVLSRAQVADVDQSYIRKKPTRRGVDISAGVHIPAGRFAHTHIGGIGVNAVARNRDFAFYKQNKLCFTWNGGVAYYLGKKETVSGYAYKYPGYLFIDAKAGLMYSPYKRTVISLTAGPAIGRYNGITRFNIAAQLDGEYYFNTKWAVSPGFMMMKESGAGPLWAASLKVVMVLKK